MKMLAARLPLLLFAGALVAQAKTPEAVVQAIAAQLKSTPSELTRYRAVVMFGETLTNTTPSKEVIATEVALLADAKAAGLFAKMPLEVRALGHNVIVHAPTHALAADYFTALCAAASGGDKTIGSDLYCATMAFGEAGERGVLAALQTDKVESRRYWIRFLAARAIHVATGKELEQRLAKETDDEVRAGMLRALAAVGLPSSLGIARKLAESATTDDVQAAALWACIEIGGFDEIAFVQTVKPVGPRATDEHKEGLAYLTKETNAKSKHGREVVSDAEFVARFGDLVACPTIAWLTQQKLLDDPALVTPPKLDAAQKKRLFELLIDSKGFGLEAVKGSVYASLAKTDEPVLLQLRAECFWSPNTMSDARVRTIDILLHTIRQEL